MTVTIRFVKDDDEVTFLLASREESGSPIDVYSPKSPLGAAITALGNVDDRLLVETLAEFLRDPAEEVRRAATEALLWDAETRWSWIRNAVRRALGDPALLDDGALRFEGQLLKPDAVTDLIAWSTEKGPLAVRSALTLGVHFSRALSERPDPLVIKDLKERLANPHAPATLRIVTYDQISMHHVDFFPVIVQEGLG